jgi:hypothetical protein
MEYYGTKDDGDSYFDEILGGDAWEGATDDNKLKALKSATMIIDRLNFAGEKYNEDQDQPHLIMH